MGCRVLGFCVLGLRVLGLRVLGFRVLGFRVLGLRVLKFRVLGRSGFWGLGFKCRFCGGNLAPFLGTPQYTVLPRV